MSKIDDYREELKSRQKWEAYLLEESQLPGPRANLELAFAVASEGTEAQFLQFAHLGPEEAPKNSRAEFLPVCGVMGLGYLASRGGARHFDLLRKCASDPRWRVREAVALGLQQYGKTAPEALFLLMVDWSGGTLLERRAVAATLCEPALLKSSEYAKRILDILDDVTSSVLMEKDRKSEAFRVLRKALGYGWSVVVASHPEIGKVRFEKWVGTDDEDIAWIMRSNLKKKRLLRMDPAWVQVQQEAIATKKQCG